MTEDIKEQKPVSESEFKEKIHDVAEYNKQKLIEDFINKGTLYLRQFSGISKCRSIRRAIKRGHISMFGDMYPKRPFNNRQRNKKGDVTYQRREIYEQIKPR